MGMRPVVVVLLYSIAGLVFVGLGIPLALGKVPPNAWYGFRTAKTLSSAAIWYPANRSAGIDFIIVGIVIVVGVPAIYILRKTVIPALPLSTCAFGLFIVCMVALIIHSFLVLNRM